MTDAGNTWDPHPLLLNANILGIITTNYTVLVEGTRAPVVITHKSTVATQFGLHKDYRESITLFQNFVDHVFANRLKGLSFDVGIEACRDKLSCPRDPRIT